MKLLLGIREKKVVTSANKHSLGINGRVLIKKLLKLKAILRANFKTEHLQFEF